MLIIQLLLELIGLLRDREKTKQVQQKDSPIIINNIIIDNKKD